MQRKNAKSGNERDFLANIESLAVGNKKEQVKNPNIPSSSSRGGLSALFGSKSSYKNPKDFEMIDCSNQAEYFESKTR